MADGACCETCRWAANVAADGNSAGPGLACIRFPPQYSRHQPANGAFTGFPRIRPDWVCGEHQPLDESRDD